MSIRSIRSINIHAWFDGMSSWNAFPSIQMSMSCARLYKLGSIVPFRGIDQHALILSSRVQSSKQEQK